MIRTDMLTSINSTGGADALPNAYQRFIILSPDNGGERINDAYAEALFIVFEKMGFLDVRVCKAGNYTQSLDHECLPCVIIVPNATLAGLSREDVTQMLDAGNIVLIEGPWPQTWDTWLGLTLDRTAEGVTNTAWRVEDPALAARMDRLLGGMRNPTCSGAYKSGDPLTIKTRAIQSRMQSDTPATFDAVNALAELPSWAIRPVNRGVHNVGDVMYDVALYYRDRAQQNSTVLQTLGLMPGAFALATCHRAENTDDPQRLSSILSALADIATQLPVVFPLHPCTRKLIGDYGLVPLLAKLTITDPLPFLDMVALEQASRLILTDSGGVQKEAFFSMGCHALC